MLKKERLPVLHWICPCFKFLLCLCIWFFFFQIKFLTHLSSAFPHHLFSPLLSHTDLRDLCHPGSWPQVWILPPEMTPDSFLFPYIVHFPVSDSLHPWFSPCLGFITGQSDNCREDPIGRYPRVVLGCQEASAGLGWAWWQPLRCLFPSLPPQHFPEQIQRDPWLLHPEPEGLAL